MSLSTKEKKHLRKLGHSLSPVVMIGDQGLKESVIAATQEALQIHELIKIKARIDDRDERLALVNSLCTKTLSELVTFIGSTALLYKKNPEQSKIDFSQSKR